MYRSGLRISTSDVVWMSAAVTSPGPRLSRRRVTGFVGGAPQHEILEVEDDVGDVFLHALDDVELVQRVVEAHLRDGRAGDRREQRATQAVAERVPETGLERRDGEPLEIAFGFAGFDLGSLNDEHEAALGQGRSGKWATWSRARR